ncbi:MAG: flagellar biosynthesis anti-sigma factor FlgM [Planctomycetota bacterium]|nr:flagellar biosynthesis anti-sigma factor FlgM [Planctomycetota bacterium]MDA1214451.1 flagellar biosynthesis anti-sigma factor FlgM [Planctomycetota bacterium]
MDVNRVGSTSPAFPVQSTGNAKSQVPAKPAGVTPIDTQDQLEISPAGKLMEQIVQQGGDVRSERLAQIRAAIDAGEYDSPQKLEAALLKMIDQVEADFTSETQ